MNLLIFKKLQYPNLVLGVKSLFYLLNLTVVSDKRFGFVKAY